MSDGNNLRISVKLPDGGARRWQMRVVEALRASPGLSVSIRRVAAAPDPVGLDLLFAFDRLFVGRAETTAVDRVETPPADEAAAVDVVLDLVGAATSDTVPVLRPTCLGAPPLAGALAALLDERTPVLELERIEPGGARRVVERWAVAVEDRNNALRGASQILGRLAHLAIVAVGDLRAEGDVARRLAPPATSAKAAPLAAPRLFLRSLETRIARRLDRLVRAPADWRVIWRRRDPATDPFAPESDPTPFRLLADDGRRFYADPFVTTHQGRAYLFVEEFPYATGRGVLSVAEIAADGAIATPRPFLEQDCHLSYPQVFAADGEIWMTPETSGRRTVELWRAVAFPDRWERHAVLLDDVDVGDATLVRHAAGWWMFGAPRETWCSSWDAVQVWQAPTLTGPWRPLGPQPALVDVASARPAGAMFEAAEGLFRPVQASSRGYGCGLALARVDRLDASGLAETVTKRFATPAPLSGLHTWNRAATPTGLVEAMDVYCRAGDFGGERRLDLAPRS
ncbi:MAG: hypothetical protein LWW93_01545 [Hyphomicrobiales bacterium]|nr:hypothetical protein [Hyphomicrobiales bacterium]